MLISLLLSSPLYLSLSGNLALYNSSSIRQQARAAVDALPRCGKPLRIYSSKPLLRFVTAIYVYTCKIDSSTYSNSDYIYTGEKMCKNYVYFSKFAKKKKKIALIRY